MIDRILSAARRARSAGIIAANTGRRSLAAIATRHFAVAAIGVSVVLAAVGVAIASPQPQELAVITASGPATVSVPATVSSAPLPAPTFSGLPSASAPRPTGTPGDGSKIVESQDGPAKVVDDTARSDGTALAVLTTIPVKGRAPKTGYDRTGAFGSAWLDVDRNGCDTRNDILARDLLVSVRSGACRVMSGSFLEPYSGQTVAFLRGNTTSALVQIDHIVALSNAWQTGAQQLTAPQRVSFANDPLNLLAVDRRLNSQKGDGDTATWLPPNKAFRCDYVARQVSVKARYGLWVTQAEHDAMVRVLTICPTIRALPNAPEPRASIRAPRPEVAPIVGVPAPLPAGALYANCAAVRAAGVAPIHRDSPGYSRKFDRDGDGVGCE